MAHKPDIVYSRGRSKSVAPSLCLIDSTNDDRDPEYVPPSNQTATPDARATRGMPKKVMPDVVTASQSGEERTLTGTPSGYTSSSEGAFGSEGSSGSESAHSIESNDATASGSGSQGATLPTEPA